MSFKCERCPEQSRCVGCQRRNAKGEVRRLARVAAENIISLSVEGVLPEEDAWLLHPDDGIIDRIAVSIAVYGEARVRLSNSERIVAATTLLRHGSTVAALCIRLALPYIVSEDQTCRTSVRLPPTGRNTAA